MFNIFDEVKSKINLHDIVPGNYKIMPSGYRYKICPICGGKNCFSIMPKGLKGNSCEIFKCFKCDNSGTIIDYYCIIHGLNNRDKKDTLTAAKKLSTNINIGKVLSSKNIIYEPKNHIKQNNTIYDFTEIAEELHENLVNKNKFYVPTFVEYKDMATSYYVDRGLSVEIIKKFKLGFCIGGMNRAFEKYPQFRIDYDLDYYNYFIPFFENDICVYILPRLDDEIYQTYKELGIIKKDCDLPKTMNLRGIPSNIFNFEGALSNDIVFITEGWCDALSLETLGYSALALNSVSNINNFIKRLNTIENYVNKYYVIAFDEDKAGYEARKKLYSKLLDLGCKVKHLYPSGEYVKDINDMLIRNRIQLEYELKKIKYDIDLEILD